MMFTKFWREIKEARRARNTTFAKNERARKRFAAYYGLPLGWIYKHGLRAYIESVRADAELNAGPPPTRDYGGLSRLHTAALRMRLGDYYEVP